ncbi:MAG: hypothetical protein ACK5RO_07480 [Pseudobdellovibrionaceae bacterium]|jgi:hypothetical protein
MRQISIVVLTLMLGLACSPRDPEVITAEDKQRLNEQRNKNRPNSTAGKKLRLNLPENFDVIAAGAFVDRSFSATDWIQKALQINSGALKTTNCERWKLRSENPQTKVFSVRYEACFIPAGDLTLNQSGSYQVVLEMNDSQIVQISVQSASFEEGLLTPEFEVKRKNFRGSLKWEEELRLVAKLEKPSEGASSWKILELEQVMMGLTRSEGADQKWQLLVTSDGEILPLDQSWLSKEWHSFIRFTSAVENGDETFFDLVVANQGEIQWSFQPCQVIQGEFDYRLNFGPKSKNKATVVMGPDGLRDKSKKELALPVATCGKRLPVLFESLLLQTPK